PVTLRCRGQPGATVYRLMKGESVIEDKLEAGAEAGFTISSMTYDTAGHYRCVYWIRSAVSEPSEPLELPSEPLELVVTGYFQQPQLSAEPSGEAARGQNVTLRCRSYQRFDGFVLYREGGANSSQWGDPQSQGDFFIPAVAAPHEGIYRCYRFHSRYPQVWSLPSDPLELRLTGPLLRPTLHADPGPLIPQGKPVTLRCRGQPGAAGYRLMKGENVIENKPGDGAEAGFTISSMTDDTAGHYRCLYWIRSAVSDPSDPLELRLT
ncbi:leukocyte immunoglobulin-like receptor subfamily A member 2, partial [Gracilinanus agilis]|uniref:leukocyte immunoglobulin-like receptor subfamily A member 2 n=1 Tax=Gracilinanus agilis TaxID=191870 RepID=UPI001CFC64F6